MRRTFGSRAENGASALVLLVWVCSLLAVAALFYFVFFQIHREESRKLSEEIGSLEQANTDLKAMEEEFRNVGLEIEQARKEFEKLRVLLPGTGGTMAVARGLTEAANASGIRFVSFDIGAQTELEDFMETPIHVRALGTYVQFSEFFSAVDRLEKILEFDRLVLEPHEISGTSVVLEGDFSIRTYGSVSE